MLGLLDSCLQASVQGLDGLVVHKPSALCPLYQQRGFLVRKYFIPRCVERALVLELRVCPLSPSPASGNLGFFPFGIEVENQGFRMAWDITGPECQAVGLKSKAFTLFFRDLASHLCNKNHESGWLWQLGV